MKINKKNLRNIDVVYVKNLTTSTGKKIEYTEFDEDLEKKVNTRTIILSVLLISLLGYLITTNTILKTSQKSFPLKKRKITSVVNTKDIIKTSKELKEKDFEVLKKNDENLKQGERNIVKIKNEDISKQNNKNFKIFGAESITKKTKKFIAPGEKNLLKKDNIVKEEKLPDHIKLGALEFYKKEGNIYITKYRILLSLIIGNESLTNLNLKHCLIKLEKNYKEKFGDECFIDILNKEEYKKYVDVNQDEVFIGENDGIIAMIYKERGVIKAREISIHAMEKMKNEIYSPLILRLK